MLTLQVSARYTYPGRLNVNHISFPVWFMVINIAPLSLGKSRNHNIIQDSYDYGVIVTLGYHGIINNFYTLLISNLIIITSLRGESSINFTYSISNTNYSYWSTQHEGTSFSISFPSLFNAQWKRKPLSLSLSPFWKDRGWLRLLSSIICTSARWPSQKWVMGPLNLPYGYVEHWCTYVTQN